MILADIAFAVSVASNIYLLFRVFSLKARVQRMVGVYEVLAREGKIDQSDLSEAARKEEAERKLDRETRRTLYGGKQ